MLEIKNLNKSYGEHKVLNDINLTINEGDIYGILGFSGAGKSTLVRCINGLETLDSGEILFNNEVFCSKSKKVTRESLKYISMIFQSFNLLNQKSVISNIELPLKLQNIKITYNKKEYKNKKEELKKEYQNNIKELEDNSKNYKEKLKELRRNYKENKKFELNKIKHKDAFRCLEKVGLISKWNSYPSMLSGGEKQRVAIARSLITNPKILLCDEATSALDVETTSQILNLLKDLHDSYNLTIIIIAHQLEVIEKICNKVALIDNSRIVENGDIRDIFLNPKSSIAKKLIYSSSINTRLSDTRSIRLLFDGNSDEPIVFDLIEKCGIKVSILKADTKVFENKVYGQLVFKLPEYDEDIIKLKSYLDYKHIKYEEID